MREKERIHIGGGVEGVEFEGLVQGSWEGALAPSGGWFGFAP